MPYPRNKLAMVYIIDISIASPGVGLNPHQGNKCIVRKNDIKKPAPVLAAISSALPVRVWVIISSPLVLRQGQQYIPYP